MKGIQELYFERDTDWYDWLLKNHMRNESVYLIFYKLEMNVPTMRWEDAVKVALCFGWIDSTVKSLGNGKRKQYFCKRNPKSYWSALNKSYISALEKTDLIHDSGYQSIKIAQQNGSWTALDSVENLIIPKDLQIAFKRNPKAFEHYQNFSKSYKKAYLYWLYSAKRKTTKQKRVLEIIRLCEANLKSRAIR